MLPFLASATTPTINDATGTVATGQTLTISGTTMVDELSTNWISRFKTADQYGFEGSSDEADGYGDAGISDGVYDTSIKLSGNQSIRWTAAGISTDFFHSPGYHQPQNVFGLNMQDFYFRGYVRYHSLDGIWYGEIGPSDGSDLKMFLAAGSGGNGNVFWQPITNANGTIPSAIAIIEDEPSVGNQLYSYAMIWKEDAWHCIEGRYSQTNHTVSLWVDGVLMGTRTNLNSSTQNFWYMGQITGWSTPVNFQLDMYVDNLAMSTSRVYPSSVIEISNSSTYGAGIVKYQYPTYLSDGMVQITTDLAGLGVGPYYLWVTNNRQERSAAFNLSGSADAASPSAPSGLAVL